MAGFGGSIKLTGETEYRKALKDITSNLKVVSSELKLTNIQFQNGDKSLKDTQESYSSASQTIDEQKNKIKTLRSQLKELENTYGSNNDKVKQFKTQVNNAEIQLSKMEKEANNATDEIKDLGNESSKADSKLKNFGSSLAGGVKNGMLALAGVATGLVAGFLALGESTQETIEDLGKLDVAFTTSGHKAETGRKAYKDFVGILGETDQSVEAVNHLAKLTKSEEELTKWTDIASGVYATFGDSLPLEGLTEASNETAKLGKLTGPLADALNWAGINEEKFQKQLDKCNSEQERATLITNTLNKTYGEAGKKYQDLNKDLIASREATASLNEAMAEMGEVAMPIMTLLKTGATELIELILPSIQLIGEAISGLVAGEDGSMEQLGTAFTTLFDSLITKATEILPTIINIGVNLILALVQGIIDSLPTLINSVMQLIPTITTTLLNMLPQILQAGIDIIVQLALGIAQMLPSLIPQAINCILTLYETLIDNIDLIIDAGIALLIGLAEGLIEALPELIDKIPVIIEKLINAIAKNLPKIIEAGVTIILQLAVGLIKAIPQLIAKIPEIIKSIKDGFASYKENMKEVGTNILKGVWDGISGWAKDLKKKVKDLAGDVVGWFKEKLDINSPSRVFRDEIGVNMAQGIGVGFEDEMKGINKQIANSIQTDYDLNTNINSSNGSSSSYNSMVNAFKDALKQMKIELDDEIAGRFIEDRVTNLIYS